jgi:methyltransferase (TIGR00027 family)
MNPDRPSPSAEEVAIYRAAHQVLDDPRIFDDPLALRVIGSDAESALRAKPVQARVDPNVRAFIAMRSRFAEDELARAVNAGVRQYVILGAGLDTFAYRNPHSAIGLRVFEADHSTMQAHKQMRLRQAAIAIPDSVTFVPLDFRHERLADVLTRYGLQSDAPAFFSMLGLVIFLPQPTVMSIFEFIASMPGASGVAFDYGALDSSLTAEKRVIRERAAKASASLGEPFVTFLDPKELATELSRMCFSRVDDLGFSDANARFFNDRRDGLQLPSSGRRVCAATRSAAARRVSGVGERC